MLFDCDMVMEYIEKNDLRKSVPNTNKWTVGRYEQLWQSLCDRAEIIYKEDIRTYEHLDLVRKYAALFKARTTDFNDFFVKRYRIVFQKK